MGGCLLSSSSYLNKLNQYLNGTHFQAEISLFPHFHLKYVEVTYHCHFIPQTAGESSWPFNHFHQWGGECTYIKNFERILEYLFFFIIKSFGDGEKFLAIFVNFFKDVGFVSNYSFRVQLNLLKRLSIGHFIQDSGLYTKYIWLFFALWLYYWSYLRINTSLCCYWRII